MLDKKQKKLWLIIAIVVVVLIIVIVLSGKKAPQPTGEEDLVPEGIDLENLPTAPEVKVEEPKAIAPGASEVTSEGIVLNEQGEAAVTEEIVPDAPEAPKQSDILSEEQKEEIAEESIQLTVSLAQGFNPSIFKVKPGQAVTIVLTGEDDDNHTLRFKDASLRAVAISISGRESRAITFNAPTTPGTYDFLCGMPDHRDKEKGQMIVANE
jgi:plastocyanin